MKVGVLGSGSVGQTLAAGFEKHGHEVMIGTRESAKLAEWLKKNPKVKVGSLSETGSFGEVVVLAVKGSVAGDALRTAGAKNLDGKLVIDACNPIADAPPVNGVLQVLHRAEFVFDGTVAEGVSGGTLRESVQFGGRAAVGESGVQGREADDVYLRQR